MRCAQRWTALEFAAVCEVVATELRARARTRAIAPGARLALFEWYEVIKDVVHRLDAAHGGAGVVKASDELGVRRVARSLRVVTR